MKNPFKRRTKNVKQVEVCSVCDGDGSEVVDCRHCVGGGCRSCNFRGYNVIQCRNCQGAGVV